MNHRALLSILIAVGTLSAAHAGYDFTVGAMTLSVVTSDGTRIPNTSFKYSVSAERLQMPCWTAGGFVPGCWMNEPIEVNLIEADASGLAQVSRRRYRSFSPLKRAAHNPTSLDLWGVTL